MRLLIFTFSLPAASSFCDQPVFQAKTRIALNSRFLSQIRAKYCAKSQCLFLRGSLHCVCVCSRMYSNCPRLRLVSSKRDRKFPSPPPLHPSSRVAEEIKFKSGSDYLGYCYFKITTAAAVYYFLGDLRRRLSSNSSPSFSLFLCHHQQHPQTTGPSSHRLKVPRRCPVARNCTVH